MCLNRLLVRNNKLDFNPVKDSYFNYVPCGNCRECREQYALGYVSRLLAHYKYIKSLGGSCHYFTLTYDSLHLPSYNGLICFNKKDVQNFFKRFREAYKKFYNSNISYFLTSEYGEDKKRPHYHVLVFSNSSISTRLFNSLVQSKWQLGNVDFGKYNGLVRDVRPLYYVSKYLTKSTDEFYHINKLPDYDLEDFYGSAVPNGFSFRSFHLQSKGLGFSLLSELKDSNFVNGVYKILDLKSKLVKLPIPLYCYRKRCYTTYLNVNGNVSYILNDFGKSILSKRINVQKNRLLDNFKGCLPYISFYYNRLRCIHSLVPYYGIPEFINRLDVNYLSSFVDWLLIYRNYSYIPFTFKNTAYDLNLLLQHLSQPDFLDDISLSYVHPQTSDYIVLEKMFFQINSYLKYEHYKEKNVSLRSFQAIKSLKTGKKKTIKDESFIDFLNFQKNNLCLTIFKNLKRKDKVSIMASPVDYKFLSLPLAV